LFLPMILIGGVGVPLAGLPVWGQRFAGFMPRRYAGALLQPTFRAIHGGFGGFFPLLGLTALWVAAGVAGTKLFRWEGGRRIARGPRWWVAGALASWAAVGAAAWQTGQLQPVLPESAAWTAITEAQIAQITFDGLPGDTDIVTPMAPSAA